ncbi:MAG: GNAT family N-acetyltransferase [Erysipelotrichaceae bacterium]
MLNYRRLNSDDTKSIQDIVKLFRNQNISYDKAISFINNPTIVLYAAFDEDQVCGYVLCYQLTRMDLGNDIFLIYHVFVLEAYQRHHIASKLLQMALDYANECKLHYVFLITQTSNVAANALYQKMGGYHHPDNKELYYWYIE